MNLYLIYKQRIDQNTGNPVSIDLIEIDMNEANATKFIKLYNLQVPVELRNKVSYGYIPTKVN